MSQSTARAEAPSRPAARRRSDGFSLLELMVVVVIIGLGLGIVSFAMGNRAPMELRNEARKFANLTALVEEEAILSRDPWGVQIYREPGENAEDTIAYRFVRFRGEEGWRPEAPPELDAGGRFPANAIATLEVEGSEQLIEPLPQKKDVEPTIWLAPGGEVTPFVLRLRFKDEQHGPEIRSDALGRIELVLQQEDELRK
jgi:general secretion pathway protein H